jgi:alkanesulfonate monooxygenase SsuD/methylene tetrahydromethanopterin reductase-like flavin-dependent oxidoreductase (luciferase family)
MLVPPGYVSEESLAKMLGGKVKPPSQLSFDELERGGYILVGSARTVRDRLLEMHRELGFGIFIGGGRIGTMSHEQAIANTERFARDVIPHFRKKTEPATTRPRSRS